MFAFQGGPVKRNVPLAQGIAGGINKATQIGTEQGVASFSPNNGISNNNSPNNGAVSNPSNEISAPSSVVTNTAIAEPGNSGAATTAETTEGNMNVANTDTTNAMAAGNSNRGSADTAPIVDAELDEDHQVKPVTEKGELQQTMIHPGGEVEKVYSGTPDEVAASDQKGIKQPLHTIVKSNGEIEKIYVGTPKENKKIINKNERKAMKEGKTKA